MELILIKSLRKVGKFGDIIKVKNGYGRNFLIPHKYAIRATEVNKKVFEDQKKVLEDKDRQLTLQSKEIVDLLNGKELTFVRQAAEDGKLFGSVTTKEIASNISSMTHHTITPAHIYLQKLIKYTGFYTAEIRLHADQFATIKLGVGRTDTEAKDFIKSKNKDAVSEQFANDNLQVELAEDNLNNTL